MSENLAVRALRQWNKSSHKMADLAVLEVLEKHETTPSGPGMDQIINEMERINEENH